MKRRELLHRLAAAGTAPLLGALPLAARAADAAIGSDTWQAQFEASTAPWKIGFATPPTDLPLVPATVRGRFPDALAGTLYRVGPAGHDLGGQRYHHWFDGDGMVQRFVIDGADVRHQGRYVATAKRVAEVRAGHRLEQAFATILPGVQPPASPDGMNVANTSVLPLGDDLLALWEGGSATRIDPATLATRGLRTWRADLAGLPFSAHPKVDPDGTVWNFGIGASQGMLILYEIAPDGTLRRADAMPVPQIAMVHDFAVTDAHLVFLMPSLVFDNARSAAGASFLDSHVWKPELGMRVLVVDKKDWSRRQMLQLPAGFLFHLGNAWAQDGPSGTLIHLDYVRSATADAVFTSNREVMRGRRVRSVEPQLVAATLNLRTGEATQHALGLAAEFPRMDPRRVGLRHRRVVHATQVFEDRPGFGAVALTDVENGRSQRFAYGAQALVEEHVFVPDGDRPGWILGTALDVAQKKTVLSCFAADALADGPVAQATLPYALPLGLHGSFVPARQG
ncbi:carotenoid oxygenase family protein [Xenophilus azovorans]|uniref:carotenoid oxygenase family protein n=1 Tax=Xenophilus azovorans TaxID=151755 RepID=UPI00056F38AB|nr:carotenoid oxygenase family protein [Xenophilus azovorans]